MDIQITRKTFCLFGYKASGKSTLAKYLATQYGEKCLYYDTLHECSTDAEFHTYRPKNTHNLGELLSVVELVKQSKKYRLFLIDEANRYIKKNSPLPQPIADMNDWCRHPQYNLAVGYIARRPVQLNPELTEIADYLFIFNLGGINDIKRLNDMRAGLGDTVQSLPPYHFVVANQARQFYVSKPVNITNLKAIHGQNAMATNL